MWTADSHFPLSEEHAMIGKYDRVGAVAHLFAHAPMDATIDPSFAYIRPLLLLRSYGVLRECYLQDCDVVFFF